jgi:prepilin-type N-terminal cleavage/methylation domain-containing protein
MTKTTRRSSAGFTLIELLTVIAIIGILAAIIIPTVGNVQKRAQRTADGSNLRQIGQSALIYAQDNKDRLPSISLSSAQATFGRTVGNANTTNVHLFAAALAVGSGLNDARMWVSKIDEGLPNGDDAPNSSLSTVVNGTKDAFTTGFTDSIPAYAVVGGLSSSDAATSPVAFTRGLNTSGAWDETAGVYKKEGGYIYFLGGNVAFYKNLGTTDGSSGDGEIVGTDGNKTINILRAFKASRRAYAEGNTGSTAAPAGLAGIGP